MNKETKNIEVVDLDEMEVVEEQQDETNEESKMKQFFGTALNVVKKAVIPAATFGVGLLIGSRIASGTTEVDVTDVIDVIEDVTEF